MAGTAEFWAGVDKLEAKIKWASLYQETLIGGSKSLPGALVSGAR